MRKETCGKVDNFRKVCVESDNNNDVKKTKLYLYEDKFNNPKLLRFWDFKVNKTRIIIEQFDRKPVLNKTKDIKNVINFSIFTFLFYLETETT
jgi:hypothetical protein